MCVCVVLCPVVNDHTFHSVSKSDRTTRRSVSCWDAAERFEESVERFSVFVRTLTWWIPYTITQVPKMLKRPLKMWQSAMSSQRCFQAKMCIHTSAFPHCITQNTTELSSSTSLLVPHMAEAQAGCHGNHLHETPDLRATGVMCTWKQISAAHSSSADTH